LNELRVDVWLWQGRFFKTRSLAARMIGEGCIRVRRGGGEVGVDKPSRVVRAGDVLSIVMGARQVVVKIEAMGERRGPASEAQALYSVLDDRRIATSDWLAPSDHGAGAP